MKDLTARQRQVLDVIRRAVDGGLPPSFREIRDALGLSGTNGVKMHLDALERKGFISQNRGPVRTRSIRILGAEPLPALRRGITTGLFFDIGDHNGQACVMLPPRRCGS